MTMRRVVCAIALAWASASGAQAHSAPGIIDGIVTDTNLVALNAATVSILGSSIRVTTGDNGRFRIAGLHNGSYVLTVNHIGYVPIAVAMGVAERDTLRPSFTLRPIARALDTMIVSERSLTQRMKEFEDRRNIVLAGNSITGDEIEKRNSVYVADTIRFVPSIGIAEKRAGVRVAQNIRGSNGVPGVPGCPFQLFLDGLPMPPLTNLANLPPPKDLAGIEIYSGPATIPLQYKYGTSSCGVILFWTKTG